MNTQAPTHSETSMNSGSQGPSLITEPTTKNLIADNVYVGHRLGNGPSKHKRSDEIKKPKRTQLRSVFVELKGEIRGNIHWIKLDFVGIRLNGKLLPPKTIRLVMEITPVSLTTDIISACLLIKRQPTGCFLSVGTKILYKFVSCTPFDDVEIHQIYATTKIILTE